jgi:hypothetical protein
MWNSAKNRHQPTGDTFGFTGVYTPIFRHADTYYQIGGYWGRFYDKKIRGWGMMSVQQEAGDTNPLRGQIVMLELKHYNQNPEIWRVGYMYNITRAMIQRATDR